MTPVTQIFRVGVVIAISATLTIAAAIAASVAHFPLTQQTISSGHGAQLFKKHCATCHSVASDASAHMGPSLHDIGRLAGTRMPGISAEEYIFRSIVDPNAYRAPGTSGEMPETAADKLSSGDLVDITAFLVAKGGQVRYHSLHALSSIQRPRNAASSFSVDLEAAERGRQLFFGKLKCSDCHSLDNTPGGALVAPRLTSTGVHTSTYLREAVLEPNSEILPSYATYSVVHEGRAYSGRLSAADEKNIRLLCVESDGAISVHEFDRPELEPLDGEETLAKSQVSTMPEYHTQMNDEELRCLLEFLATLR